MGKDYCKDPWVIDGMLGTVFFTMVISHETYVSTNFDDDYPITRQVEKSSTELKYKNEVTFKKLREESLNLRDNWYDLIGAFDKKRTIFTL